jgi:hypothetical protein
MGNLGKIFKQIISKIVYITAVMKADILKVTERQDAILGRVVRHFQLHRWSLRDTFIVY